MSIQVTGIITAAGEAQAVAITPGASDNVVALILYGVYNGVVAVLETSLDGGATWVTTPAIFTGTYQPDGPFIQPQSGAALSWGFNITSGQRIRIRPTAFGAGELDVILVSAVVAGGLPILTAPVPTPVDRSLQGAAQALAPSMPAVVGKTNYVTRIAVDGMGATAALVTAAQLSGLPHTLIFPFVVPAGASTPLGGSKLDITFNPPIAATGTNTAVVLTVPSFGSGNTYASVSVQGFNQ